MERIALVGAGLVGQAWAIVSAGPLDASLGTAAGAATVGTAPHGEAASDQSAGTAFPGAAAGPPSDAGVLARRSMRRIESPAMIPRRAGSESSYPGQVCSKVGWSLIRLGSSRPGGIT
jgi:hypothetical protein